MFTTITFNPHTRCVYVDGERLLPDESQEVINHSPDGFEWGYSGSGPAQLALALLLRFTDKETAIQFHQRFKHDFIQDLPRDVKEANIDVETWLENEKD